MNRLELVPAKAKGGKVTANGGEIPSVNILSQGQEESSGILFVNGKDKVYIAIPINSLKSILDLISNLAQTAAGGVLAKNGGGDITSPNFAASMQALALQAELLKDKLQ